MFKAKDIMTAHVVAVGPEETIDRAVSLMVRHRISGLPVVDEQNRPLGIVSEFDLLGLICEGHVESDRVARYVSPNLYCVAEEDGWVRVADVFREKRVRRLPVLREGKLVGIVTRHDLVRAIRDARRRLRRCGVQAQVLRGNRPPPGSTDLETSSEPSARQEALREETHPL